MKYKDVPTGEQFIPMLQTAIPLIKLNHLSVVAIDHKYNAVNPDTGALWKIGEDEPVKKFERVFEKLSASPIVE